MSQKVNRIITDKFIEKLEEGTVPWRKPFPTGSMIPLRWECRKPYRGINLLLLEPGGEYATFKQIKKHGGKIKKGARHSLSIFWKWYKIREDENGDPLPADADDEEADNIRQFGKPLYHKVFEINTQVEGLESHRESLNRYIHDPIDEAEEMITEYPVPPKMTHSSSGAWYSPTSDVVNVPKMEEFDDVHEYYSTFFHELIHSTGHESRLRRFREASAFGSEDYSYEELVAEIGSNFLACHAGFDEEVFENSASYVNGWIQVLDNDPSMIVNASQTAQKAADYILDEEHEEK